MASKEMQRNNNIKKVENFVRNDGVIKEQISLENHTRNRYEDKWGILLDFDKICCEIAEQEEGIDASDFRRMLSRCCTRHRRGHPALNDDWKLPSSGPVPRTTTGEVGWRSAKAACNLELYGPLYRSPKTTMEPVHTPTNTIFLG